MPHPDGLNPWFSLLYLLFTTGMVVTEIVGIRRKSKDKATQGDTITENWYWVDKHLTGAPRWAWRVFTAGMLVWTLLHFAGTGWR